MGDANDKEETPQENTQAPSTTSGIEDEIPANKLKEHIEKLIQRKNPMEPMYNGFDEEFNVFIYLIIF